MPGPYVIRERLSKSVTRIKGPLFSQQHRIVQMDITYDCDLKCRRCCRQCSQAATKEHISVRQIKEFIAESVEQQREWAFLRIMGGEPTLHPDLFEIIDLLIEYKKKYSPETILRLETNGFGKGKGGILTKMPPEIVVFSTQKTNPFPQQFGKVNIAPVDLPELDAIDYSNACHFKQNCGIGFTPYGYYTCGTAGAIDRVFGLDIGRKKLPASDDMMVEQSEKLCGYCGAFIAANQLGIEAEEEMSPSWIKALKNYARKKPILSPV